MRGQGHGRRLAGVAVLLMLVMGLLVRTDAVGLPCGKPRPVTRVAGGVNAQKGQWAWQVSLQHRGQHICGGSLISHRWILTAAHCFPEVGLPIVPKNWKVILGRLRLTGDPLKGEERDVVEIIMHENYTNYDKGHDIALVRLAQPVRFKRDISAICLPYADHQFAFGTQCWVTGWGDIGMNDLAYARGRTIFAPGDGNAYYAPECSQFWIAILGDCENQIQQLTFYRDVGQASLSDPMHLQEMALDVVSRDTCNCVYNNLRDREIVYPALPGMICAMTPDSRRGPCKGDSGGPLVCLEDDRWFQAGIMSFSMGCERLNGPIILTETKAYVDWIQNHVHVAAFANQTEPRPNTTDEYLCTGCGTLKQDTRGSGAVGFWPWYASLQYEGKHACGGTLISEDWIVTSAQCFIGRQEPETWVVLLGERKAGLKHEWQERRTFQSIVLHGAYFNATEGDDIAVAKLDRPVKFNNHIRAICNPYKAHKFPFGSTCWTRGRTTDETGTPSPPGGVEVKILGPRNCNCRYNLTSAHGHEIPISSQMLCAMPLKRTMRCEETSGEPLICNEKGSWFLAGISSFGKGCGTVMRPGVYTAVNTYEKWIRDLVWLAYYDVQKPPVPTVKDDDSCLILRPPGMRLR